MRARAREEAFALILFPDGGPNRYRVVAIPYRFVPIAIGTGSGYFVRRDFSEGGQKRKIEIIQKKLIF